MPKKKGSKKNKTPRQTKGMAYIILNNLLTSDC